ncbi:hypothetical protein MPRF_47060 [Mycolicibacterium parafortuitum]|uniref:Uncharacterized protein n=1 Tax=Mycolicibacterium parafortuitum TaxID=39692 RepID=A0A7I7U976_MYCPF|nr:hypothetical protein MPRF_47060 [Mycolicibacterium parafortuitum]
MLAHRVKRTSAVSRTVSGSGRQSTAGSDPGVLDESMGAFSFMAGRGRSKCYETGFNLDELMRPPVAPSRATAENARVTMPRPTDRPRSTGPTVTGALPTKAH